MIYSSEVLIGSEKPYLIFFIFISFHSFKYSLPEVKYFCRRFKGNVTVRLYNRCLPRPVLIITFIHMVGENMSKFQVFKVDRFNSGGGGFNDIDIDGSVLFHYT